MSTRHCELFPLENTGSSLSNGHTVVLDPLNRCRAGHAIVTVQGKAYAVGGKGMGEPYRHIERFDPAVDNLATSSSSNTAMERMERNIGCVVRGKWSLLDHHDQLMNHGRFKSGVAATDTAIWVCGGQTGPRLVTLSSVEVFDVSAGRWHTGPELPYPLKHAAAVSAHGRIYLIGGCTSDGHSRQPSTTCSSCLVLDTALGPLAEWEALESMNQARAAHTAVVRHLPQAESGSTEFEIFVFDGASTEVNAIPTAEMYRSVTRKWESLPALEWPDRAFTKFATVLVH
jgi:hypothetical protein